MRSRIYSEFLNAFLRSFGFKKDSKVHWGIGELTKRLQLCKFHLSVRVLPAGTGERNLVFYCNEKNFSRGLFLRSYGSNKSINEDNMTTKEILSFSNLSYDRACVGRKERTSHYLSDQ